MKLPFVLSVALLPFVSAFAGELDIARAALRDGLWSIARQHAQEIDDDEARLLVLESYAGEGRWEALSDALKEYEDSKGAGFDYYRALAKGDHARAIGILKEIGGVEGLTEALMFEADGLVKAGKTEEAERIWRKVVAETNLCDRVLIAASVNLRDAAALRRAYEQVVLPADRRRVGLQLGLSLLRNPQSADEGMRLIRAIVKDAPDAEGADRAFLALADAKLDVGEWQAALNLFREAIEIWPESAKNPSLQEGLGWASLKLGRAEEALESFRMAERAASSDEDRARVIVKQGDALMQMGQDDQAMASYRKVADRYGETQIAARLKETMDIREQEAQGRELYREFRFDEARKVFAKVAEADASRKQRMRFYEVLCLYGLGRDDEAGIRAQELATDCPDDSIRSDAILWLAKLCYNRREWKESEARFMAFAEMTPDENAGAEALLWAARAALADGDCETAIRVSTRLVAQSPLSPCKPAALLVQGEALIELARFDEAILVLERVILAEDVEVEDRLRAQILSADALYAMGADNSARYTSALEAYRAIRFGGSLSPSVRLVVAFKIARTLEKLKRLDEAIDQYYAQVVLAYRDGREHGLRFNDEARAVFARAAFKLADEYESRGRDRQAIAVLRLVALSDVPAVDEALRRINRISSKGRFL